MSAELELEVCKRYEVRGEPGSNSLRTAFVAVDWGGVFLGCISGSTGIQEWKGDGRVFLGDGSDHVLDLVRCLDDEPALADLSKIDVPFGDLNNVTKYALVGAYSVGIDIECCASGVWTDCPGPVWTPTGRYRTKSKLACTLPTVDIVVWKMLDPHVVAVCWGGNGRIYFAYDIPPTRGFNWEWHGKVVQGPGQGEMFLKGITRGDCQWEQSLVLRPVDLS